MPESKLQLAKDFSMPAINYAGQGNAILGIRDAGKTYTALKAAEQLLDAGIPIIAYDPVGIWKNLKVGTGKNKGYPVVVAGGAGSDIRLTPDNAVDIVRAAMKENVSLVIDLYSPELINKSKWIRIVQETIDLLMYENKECGMRHIFIEEAAEFIPQRLQPQHAKVYASLERLARMGRNARLGYTLINQRAEEVNKAILEISAFSLLHKQVGKNSLKSIQTWLELLQLDNAKDIIKSLPSLKQGQCWTIGMEAEARLIQISERKTFHPDPKKNAPAASTSDKAKVDVSSFVEKLNKQLQKPEPAVPAKKPTGEGQISEPYLKLSQQFFEYKNATNELLSKQEKVIKEQHALIQKLLKNQQSIRKIVGDQDLTIDVALLAPVSINIPKTERIIPKNVQNVQKMEKLGDSGNLGKCARAILQFLATFPDRSFTKPQIGIAIGYSPMSGGFNNALSELNSRELIIRDSGRISVNEGAAAPVLGDYEVQSYSIHTFRNKLGKCEREIYDVLLKHPRHQFSKESLADATESRYSANTGGFNNALSALNTLELIKRERGVIQLNPELLEL